MRESLLLNDDILKDLTVDGLTAYIRGLGAAASNLVPNPFIDIVDWIEGNPEKGIEPAIILPSSVSTRPGPMVLTPVQRHLARLFQKLGVRRVSFLKTPRMGSTLFNAVVLLYFAVHEGVDVLYYERTDPDAQAFHDKKLYPIMLESPKVAEQMRPDSRSGIQDKWTDRILRTGAALQLRSGFGDGSARAIKGKFIAIDEASSKEFQPGKTEGEGNKVEKIWRRGQEFADTIMYIGGTPTNEDICIVTQEYLKGDRNVIDMLFPCCDTWQAFEPDVQRVATKDDRKGAGLRYLQDDEGRILDVWYECGNPDCRSCLPEIEKTMMMENSRLRPTAEPIDPMYASVYAWLAYSSDPQATWTDIARQHRDSLIDPSQRQPFQNLTLAKAWVEEPPRAIPVSELEKRAIEYPNGGDVPEYCTDGFGGMDNQQGGLNAISRSEATFYGIGPNQRRAIAKRVVFSHYEHRHEDGTVELVPAEPFTKPWMELVWQELDKGLTTSDGRHLPISRFGVDVGWRMHEALIFCYHPESRKRGIFPVRGRKETGTRVPILPNVLSKHFKSSLQFAMIAGQTAKDYIYDSLLKPSGAAHSWDFPSDIKRLGEDFYVQLLSEGLVETHKGSKVYMWEKIKQDKPNEVLDTFVYGLCAELYECKRNRETRKRLSVQFDAPIAPAPVDGMVALMKAVHELTTRKPVLETPTSDADDATMTDVSEAPEPIAPQPEQPKSLINSRVVRRPKRVQQAEQPRPVERVKRRSRPARVADW